MKIVAFDLFLITFRPFLKNLIFETASVLFRYFRDLARYPRK